MSDCLPWDWTDRRACRTHTCLPPSKRSRWLLSWLLTRPTQQDLRMGTLPTAVVHQRVAVALDFPLGQQGSPGGAFSVTGSALKLAML